MLENGGRLAIPEQIIEDLKSSLPQGLVEMPDPSVEPGAEVQLITGTLKGLNGTVLAQLPAKNRIEILLNFLGREITVAVSAEDIILADND